MFLFITFSFYIFKFKFNSISLLFFPSIKITKYLINSRNTLFNTQDLRIYNKFFQNIIKKIYFNK